MKILVSGPRNWHPWFLVRGTLQEFDIQSTIFVHGDCKSGIDAVVDQVVIEMGGSVVREPADWDGMEARGLPRGAAVPIRNQRMIDEHRDADLALIFHPNLNPDKKGSGTADFYRRAMRAGLPVRIVSKEDL